MKILVTENNLGHCFEISNLSVHNTLTFCNINGNTVLYPVLTHLVKAGIINFFEPKENVIHVAFYTKYVEEIF